jgi:hypothetical protein
MRGPHPMFRLAAHVSAILIFFAATAPAKAMELCEALDAEEETRAQVTGVVDDLDADPDDPYLFLTTRDGECTMLVFATDPAMVAACKKGMTATAIGVLRWDEEAMFVEDLDQNLLDEASVVCE